MANKKSSKKRIRQTTKKTTVNTMARSKVKTAVRKAREAITTKSAEVGAAVKTAISSLQKAGTRGISHKRTVARKTSRLAKQANKVLASTKK
ncbi:MAG: 30S ribosomal protein S20 [Bdellovibrionota bacterium]